MLTAILFLGFFILGMTVAYIGYEQIGEILGKYADCKAKIKRDNK